MGYLLLKALIFLNSMNALAQQTSFRDTIAAYFNEIKAATVDIPTRIGKGKVLGDGWTLELKPGFYVQKEDANGNFVLKKK